jgi:hypothetical protein
MFAFLLLLLPTQSLLLVWYAVLAKHTCEHRTPCLTQLTSLGQDRFQTDSWLAIASVQFGDNDHHLECHVYIYRRHPPLPTTRVLSLPPSLSSTSPFLLSLAQDTKNIPWHYVNSKRILLLSCVHTLRELLKSISSNPVNHN